MHSSTPTPLRRDFEAIGRLKELLKGESINALARRLGVNKGSISQVLGGQVFYSASVRRALGLWTLPAWRHEPNAIPLTHLSGGKLRQCPDCVEEWQRGERTEAETWHWFNVSNRKRCADHARLRRNARRRQAAQVQTPQTTAQPLARAS